MSKLNIVARLTDLSRLLDISDCEFTARQGAPLIAVKLHQLTDKIGIDGSQFIGADRFTLQFGKQPSGRFSWKLWQVIGDKREQPDLFLQLEILISKFLLDEIEAML